MTTVKVLLPLGAAWILGAVSLALYGWAKAQHGRCTECRRTHQRLYDYLGVKLCLRCFHGALAWNVSPNERVNRTD